MKLFEASPVAGSVPYDNTESGIPGTNVQDAIDDVYSAINTKIAYPNVIKNAQVVMDASLTIQNNTGLRVTRPNGSTEMVRFIGSSTIQSNGSLTISSNGQMRVIGV